MSVSTVEILLPQRLGRNPEIINETIEEKQDRPDTAMRAILTHAVGAEQEIVEAAREACEQIADAIQRLLNDQEPENPSS